MEEKIIPLRRNFFLENKTGCRVPLDHRSLFQFNQVQAPIHNIGLEPFRAHYPGTETLQDRLKLPGYYSPG